MIFARMKYLALILILFQECLVLSLEAQKSNFQYYQYNTLHGLPSQTVYNVIEDRSGFLWICTDAGVSRYDGISFTNYTKEQNLGESEILELFEDSKGRIWFLPFFGKISYWHDGKIFSPDNSPFLAHLPIGNGIRHILEDNKGNIYIISLGECLSLCHIDKNDISKRIQLPDSVNDFHCIQDISKTAEGKVIVTSTNHKFFTIENDKLINNDFYKSIIKNANKISSTDLNGFYFMDSIGLNSIENGQKKILILKNSIENPESITAVNIDMYNNIWISNSIQNNIFYQFHKDHYLSPYPILKNTQANVCFDKSGNAWLCSSVEGLIKIPINILIQDNFQINEQLKLPRIHSSFISSDQTLWFGYWNGVISSYKDNKIRHYNLNQGTRTYNRVLAIDEDNKGNIYVATDEGGSRLIKQNTNHYTLEHWQNNVNVKPNAKGLLKTDQGKVLFSSGFFIFGFDDQAEFMPDYIFKLPKNRKFSNYYDHDGLLSSTTLGVILTNPDSSIQLASKNKILSCRVNMFLKLSSEDILLATHGEGLIILRNKEFFQRLNLEDELAGMICRYAIIKNDSIFIATNNGISLVKLVSNKYKVLRNFYASDGIICNDITSLLLYNNLLYVSTTNGCSVLDLSKEVNSDRKNKVIINSFMVNGKQYSIDSTLKFNFSNYHIEINFITPSLNTASKISYRYKLNPQDKEWISTPLTSLSFANLNPENYTLHLQSKLNNGDWSEATLVKFSILPPFYKTNFFRISITTFLVAIIFLITRFITKRKYAKALQYAHTQEEVLKERNRIASDIHDDIGAELTNLVILSRIIKEQSQSQNNLVNKLETTSNELINKMNDVIWALNPTNDTINNLIAHINYYVRNFLEQNNLNGELDFNGLNSMNISISAQQRRNLVLIIKEFLNNTIKHSKADSIKLKVCLINDILRVSISDNGIGMVINDQLLPGNGILNIKKRITQSKGIYEFKQNVPSGLKLEFTLPLTLDYENK